MTPSQLDEIKRMTVQERLAKYNKRLFLHSNDPLKLTPAQLKTIINLPVIGQPVEPSHDQDQTGEAVDSANASEPCARSLTETLLEQFPGSYVVEEPEAKSHKAKLLSLLMDGQKHNTKEIAQKVFGVRDESVYCNIHGRASDLRKEGWDIPHADSKEARNEKGEICYWIKNTNRIV